MLPAQVCALLPEAGFSKSRDNYYDNSKKFKVLWLLHGATEDYETWLNKVGLEKILQNHDVITIIPNALNSDYANHGEFANGYYFEDFFFEELMPFVYHTFPASEDAQDNYISGFSMGGAGALMLGLVHPEKFNGISPMGASERKADFLDPYMLLSGSEFRIFAKENRNSLPTEFGDPSIGITDKEINMIARYPLVQDYCNSEECTGNRLDETICSSNIPEIYFCCGENDGCCSKVIDLVNKYKDNGKNKISAEILPGKNHNDARDTTIHMIKHFGL